MCEVVVGNIKKPSAAALRESEAQWWQVSQVGFHEETDKFTVNKGREMTFRKIILMFWQFLYK